MLNTFKMRQPCANCESPFGHVDSRNGQSCVFCSVCGKWVYNAPRTETGERQRSVSTVHKDIKPRTRARVIIRANGHCEFCGLNLQKTNVHIEHLISVDEGLKEGLSDLELNHQENLVAICEECNLGLGKESVPPRMLYRITALRLAIRRATA